MEYGDDRIDDEISVVEKQAFRDLLDIPIPTHHRIAHLYPSTNPEGDYSEVLVEEERQWDELYAHIEHGVTEFAVSKIIGRSPQWVHKMATELEIGMTEKVIIGGRERVAYPKVLIPQLRHIILSFMPAGDWYTKKELVGLIGKDWPWLKKILDAESIVPEKRWNQTNRLYDHYPPESIIYLRRAWLEQPERAGTWRTLNNVSTRTGKSLHWFQARWKIHFNEAAEQRIDETGKPATHYPEEIWTELEAMAAETLRYKPVDDYVSMVAITAIVGKSRLWVANRLLYTHLLAEKRIDVRGQVYDCYPPVIIERLLCLPKDVLNYNPSYFTYPEYEPPEELPVPTPRPIKFLPLTVVTLYQGPDDEPPTQENWGEFALCAQTDPELFFSDRGGSNKDAKKVCGRCAVTAFCLEYALETNQRGGVWGGLSDRQRLKLEKEKAGIS